MVAAVAVFLAVKGSKGSSAPANAAPAPSAPAPVAVKPHVVPVTPSPPVPPSVGHAVPLPGPYRPAPIQVGFFFEFWIPPRPLVLAPEAPPEDPWGAPGPPLALDGAPPDLDELAEPPPPDPGPMSAVALQLPPLAEAVNFPVEDRSFFAGPHTALQLDLIDRASGRLLWSKAVAGGEDPLDEGAMSPLSGSTAAGSAARHPLTFPQWSDDQISERSDQCPPAALRRSPAGSRRSARSAATSRSPSRSAA